MARGVQIMSSVMLMSMLAVNEDDNGGSGGGNGCAPLRARATVHGVRPRDGGALR